MSAQAYGSINFSLDDETGLYQESLTKDISCQEREVVGGGGEVLAGAFYKHTGTFSIDGALKTGTSPSWDLSGALTIANSMAIEDLVPGYTSGAKFIITSVSGSLGAEAEERRTIAGVIKPFLGALVS
jgi:hypothetical protein